MKKERCLICNFQGKISHNVGLNVLYEPSNIHQHILLCYNHSVELFKTGQVNFLQKYKLEFHDHGLDTDKFLELRTSFNLFSFR